MNCNHCGSAVPEGAAYCSACGARIGDPPFAGPVTTVRYAGFWRRAVAWVIDYFVLLVTVILTAFALVLAFGGMLEGIGVGLDGNERVLDSIGRIMGLAATWLYYTVMESSPLQATLGKKVMRIVVTDMDGERISFGRANSRYWGKILSGMFLMVGFIMTAFTKRKQAFHDVLAETLVVVKQEGGARTPASAAGGVAVPSPTREAP